MDFTLKFLHSSFLIPKAFVFFFYSFCWLECRNGLVGKPSNAPLTFLVFKHTEHTIHKFILLNHQFSWGRQLFLLGKPPTQLTQFIRASLAYEVALHRGNSSAIVHGLMTLVLPVVFRYLQLGGFSFGDNPLFVSFCFSLQECEEFLRFCLAMQPDKSM